MNDPSTKRFITKICLLGVSIIPDLIKVGHLGRQAVKLEKKMDLYDQDIVFLHCRGKQDMKTEIEKALKVMKGHPAQGQGTRRLVEISLGSQPEIPLALESQQERRIEVNRELGSLLVNQQEIPQEAQLEIQ